MGQVVEYPAFGKDDKRPRVLLAGNGMCRCYNSRSWESLLASIKRNECKVDLTSEEFKNVPFPIGAIIATDDHVDEACGVIARDLMKESYYMAKGELALFREMLAVDFDAVITTNYSYEFEYAMDSKFLKKSNKYAAHTDGCARKEVCYPLYSFYRMPYNGQLKDIWHIHGEAKNKSSIVLGQYYYINSISKWRAYLKDAYTKYYKKEEDKIRPKSWLEYFIFGDVYIVGFGMDLSEIDLWWLLNRKKREELPHGKTVFIKDANEELDMMKRSMLEVMDVEIREFSCEDKDGKTDYQGLYRKIIEWLKDGAVSV